MRSLAEAFSICSPVAVIDPKGNSTPISTNRGFRPMADVSRTQTSNLSNGYNRYLHWLRLPCASACRRSDGVEPGNKCFHGLRGLQYGPLAVRAGFAPRHE